MAAITDRPGGANATNACRAPRYVLPTSQGTRPSISVTGAPSQTVLTLTRHPRRSLDHPIQVADAIPQGRHELRHVGFALQTPKALRGFEHRRGGHRTRRVLTIRQRVCFDVFMRTTVEFPPDLFRKAKARAAARGESLKTLLTRAVAVEIGRGREGSSDHRVTLPLFGDPSGPAVDVDAADLARALADEDVVLVRPRRRRRR